MNVSSQELYEILLEVCTKALKEGRESPEIYIGWDSGELHALVSHPAFAWQRDHIPWSEELGPYYVRMAGVKINIVGSKRDE